MKAIVKVSKTSSYSKFNGLTFEVEKLLPGMVALLIPNKEFNRNITTDFGYSEVVIVDVVKELEKASYTNSFNHHSDLMYLEAYCDKNKIARTK